MYRFRLVLIACVSIVGFATLSPASSHAQISSNGDGGVLFADKTSAASVAYKSLLDKLYDMDMMGHTIINQALFNEPEYAPRVISGAVAILRDYNTNPVFDRDSGLEYGSYGPPVEGIQYTYISESCAEQTECSLIDIRQVAKKFTRALPARRKFFRRCVEWALKEKVGHINRAKVQREYNRRESELRKILRSLPPTLALTKTMVEPR